MTDLSVHEQSWIDERNLTRVLAQAPDLEYEVVHVWVADLRSLQSIEQPGQTWMSDDEHRRASRFVFESDRRRFHLSRAFLRSVLGRYLGTPPESVRFVRGNGQKPQLDRRCDSAKDLRFNLSHSGDYAICAIGLGREVGVDLECPRSDVDHLALARRFFHPIEYRALADLDPAQLADEFLLYWTGKEAYLKTRGLGLEAGLDTFWLRFDSHHTTAYVMATNADPIRPNWSLRVLRFFAGHVRAAVASEGTGWQVWISHIGRSEVT